MTSNSRESDEESQDDIATILPSGRGPSIIATLAVERQRRGLHMVGAYIAATLDGEYHDTEIILEGECAVAVRIYDRRTGMQIGQGTVTVPIAFAVEHSR